MSAADSAQPFNALFLSSDSPLKPPFYEGKHVLLDGRLEQWTGDVSTVYSPLLRQSGERIAIGSAPNMGEADALRAVHSAAKAYGHGLGSWPTCGVAERIACIQRFIVGLQAKRDEIVNLLMWEICKNKEDAQKEVDRTIQYIKGRCAASPASALRMALAG